MEKAVLGGGCFWCVEAVLKDLAGVHSVKPGYAGGHADAPTYEQVCTKTTGHAEVVDITFDPEILSFADLLRIFFVTHDPTTQDRQGNDVGPQYRSVIFCENEAQMETARAVKAEIEAEKIWDASIVTQIEPAAHIWPAEAYHEDYFARNPAQPYCAAVIAPKVAKMRRHFSERLKKGAET
ncbi:peptide-methionine (S)-S-oxide reductase MsrA [Acetobacter sp. AN02]|uniref:peptide-methionine (S)-S-oxide reductase MsrA n=1 Tax=Acetobacter sp. AN02 TaxID=2894186 RepID=UPI00243413CF|nr:peptide-methionine (S)-S-oxide reductase MsrA [Acetobacter sp. AN02]MDG6093597.1 peptide-methionine (S)-S-oxide reductase MsrA [Acetobacter sp. AN02]